jgi:secretion/DNA translocation related TadE-like protein
VTRPRPRGRPAERGAATVLTIAFAGLLLLLGAALGVVQAMVVAHRTAQSAADLAALAGAEAELRGEAGCAVATAVAEANGATLTGCEAGVVDLWVEVLVPGPHWLGQSGDLAASSRAGREKGGGP